MKHKDSGQRSNFLEEIWNNSNHLELFFEDLREKMCANI